MPRSRCPGVRTALRLATVFLVLLLTLRSDRLAAQPADLVTARQQVLALNLAGDYLGALAMARHALVLAEREHGAKSEEAASAHLSIAIQHQSLGQLPEAEARFREGMALQKRLVDPNDPSLAQFAAGLGALLHGQGRYEEAEPLMREAIRLHEIGVRRHGDETGLAVALFMLGSSYTAMERLDDGKRLLERALAAFERLAPQGSMQIGIVLNNIATNRQLAKDYQSALENQERARVMFERFSPGNLPGIAKINNNLGFLHQQAGSPDQADERYRAAIDLLTRAFPDGHPDAATAKLNYGHLLLELGRPAEAESLLLAALAESRRFLPPEHPDIAVAHGELADLRIRAGDWERAAGELDAAAGIHLARAARLEAGRASNTGGDVRHNAFTFTKLVKLEHRRSAPDAGRAFVLAQHALGSSAAASLAQMAVRNAKGDARLSSLVRSRQDLVAEWNALDRDLLATLAGTTPANDAGESIRRKLAAVDQRIGAIDRDIAERFPDYTALANPRPLTIDDVQRDLGVDEALVLMLDTPQHLVLSEETFVWVVTRDASRWVHSTLGSEALRREVAALRCGLDEAAWTGSTCLDLTGQIRTDADRSRGKPLPFDAARAHRLHAALLGEVGDLVAGKHLLVVPAGPLTQLPLQVLVTRPPLAGTPVAGAAAAGPTPGSTSAQGVATRTTTTVGIPPPSAQARGQTPDSSPQGAGEKSQGGPAQAAGEVDVRNVAWLARSHAITVLPAVTSLKALRRIGRPSTASKPMLGFGNPLLDGPDARYAASARAARAKQRCRQTTLQRVAALVGLRDPVARIATRGGLAALDHLRAQVPLPETADELCVVAHHVGADPDAVRLGSRASEREVKRASADGTLAAHRILHFATHGALAGELDGTHEPGLILTPPTRPSAEDDGYLSASEIAGLKLDADWVILSACNTAAGGAVGAEALSGLARAFFYAGARALLVSHWAVSSEATVTLVTTAMRAMAKDARVGRAEALRRAMLAMIDEGEPQEALPASWAPFVVVGEGAAR